MSVQEDYLDYKRKLNLSPNRFGDRVTLEKYLRHRLEDIWSEKPRFTHGGLMKNKMTGFALPFAYYDCRPTPFCITRCYGLRLAGMFDYNMLRLAVVASESLKTGDPRFLERLDQKVHALESLNIGHWGDAVSEQIPTIAEVVSTASFELPFRPGGSTVLRAYSAAGSAGASSAAGISSWVLSRPSLASTA